MSTQMCPDCEGFGLACHRCEGHGFLTGRQSRKMSLVEISTSTAIGFVVALVTTHFVMPAFGHPVTLSENFWITCIFTVVSIVRGYCVRRLFEAMR